MPGCVGKEKQTNKQNIADTFFFWAKLLHDFFFSLLIIIQLHQDHFSQNNLNSSVWRQKRKPNCIFVDKIKENNKPFSYCCVIYLKFFDYIIVVCFARLQNMKWQYDVSMYEKWIPQKVYHTSIDFDIHLCLSTRAQRVYQFSPEKFS